MRKLILAVATTVAASIAPILMIATGASATTPRESFSFADTSTGDGPPAYSVIATGAFVAGGTATQESKGVPLTLRFPAGTITLHTAKRHKTLSKSQTATACLQTQTASGAYTITGGTGAYRGISGSGRPPSPAQPRPDPGGRDRSHCVTITPGPSSPKFHGRRGNLDLWR